MRDGAINFLHKPIDLEQLIIGVEKAMRKLNTERALKYRTRELELTKEIIARVTMDRDLVIDMRNTTGGSARDYASELLNGSHDTRRR